MGTSVTWRADRNAWQATVKRDNVPVTRMVPREVASTKRHRRRAIQWAEDTLVPVLKRKLRERGAEGTLWELCREYGLDHGLASHSWQSRKSHLATLMADLGHLRPAELTTPVMTAWLSGLAARGLALGTVRQAASAVGAVYRYGLRTGKVTARPYEVHLPPGMTPPDEVATWDPHEIAALLETAQRLDIHVWRLLRFLHLTGCRPIEALRVRWADVRDLPPPGTVELWDAKGQRGQRRRRRLPLSGELGAFVRDLERIGTHVFTNSRGRPWSEWPFKRWDAVRQAAGVEGHVYQFRHTFITERLRERVDVFRLAEWCGTSVQMIQKTYAHLLPQDLGEVATSRDAVRELAPPPRNVVELTQAKEETER